MRYSTFTALTLLAGFGLSGPIAREILTIVSALLQTEIVITWTTRPPSGWHLTGACLALCLYAWIAAGLIATAKRQQNRCLEVDSERWAAAAA